MHYAKCVNLIVHPSQSKGARNKAMGCSVWGAGAGAPAPFPPGASCVGGIRQSIQPPEGKRLSPSGDLLMNISSPSKCSGPKARELLTIRGHYDILIYIELRQTNRLDL